MLPQKLLKEKMAQMQTKCCSLNLLTRKKKSCSHGHQGTPEESDSEVAGSGRPIKVQLPQNQSCPRVKWRLGPWNRLAWTALTASTTHWPSEEHHQAWNHPHCRKPPAWVRVRNLFTYISLQSCAYGKRRPKSTELDYRQLRASAGLQPKASEVIAVVPEHKQVLVLTGPKQECSFPCVRVERLSESFAVPPLCQCTLRVLPLGAQLLHLRASANQAEGLSSCVAVWGIPYTPCEFVQTALKSGHPSLAAAKLPDPLVSATQTCAQCEREPLR